MFYFSELGEWGGGNSLGYQCLTSPKSVLGVGLGFDANAGLLRVTNE